MIIPTSVRLNGKVFTRNSVAIRVNGIIRITDVDSIDWHDENPHELVQGMNSGGFPIGKAEGMYACDATIGIYADATSKWEAAILAGDPTAGNNLSAANFQLSIIMSEEFRTKSIVLMNCNITARPTRTVGADGSAIVMQYGLQPVAIVEDGKTLRNITPVL